jgi:hypothetical protein
MAKVEDGVWDAVDDTVQHGEDTSKRIAICNIDWGSITAADIFGMMLRLC